MTTAREGHAAVLLNNGQVLITGGNDPGTGSLNTAELYDPSSDVFIAVTGAMTTPRISHAMTLLNGGQVLIVGGASGASGTALASTETYNPASQLFTAAGSMASAREYQTDTLLNDGTVFIAGGTDGTNIFNTAELYMPSQLNGLTSIAVTPSQPLDWHGSTAAFHSGWNVSAMATPKAWHQCCGVPRISALPQSATMRQIPGLLRV